MQDLVMSPASRLHLDLLPSCWAVRFCHQEPGCVQHFCRSPSGKGIPRCVDAGELQLRMYAEHSSPFLISPFLSPSLHTSQPCPSTYRDISRHLAIPQKMYRDGIFCLFFNSKLVTISMDLQASQQRATIMPYSNLWSLTS
jgi:hypothetical protein